jgi:glycerophosphoryl diester phosphodiesterase
MPPTACLRLAHRGDWRRAPENTIAAFRAALAIPGCDGIELDVQAARDGTPIVIHDDTLERIQGRPGRVDALAVTDLADAGVPTLAEVLETLPRHAFLDVELKANVAPAAVAVLAGARGATLGRGVVSSFDPGILDRVARLAPSWPRWLNSVDLDPARIATAVELGCTAVATEWHAIDRAAVARAGAAGLAVAAWTVRRRSTFDRLAGLGVIAVCAEASALDGGAEEAA